MWQRIGRGIRNSIPLIVLLIILGVVTWRNYPWSTSLLGWDSVQPELNFPLNLERSLTSVWAGNQGVGHIGGHGYGTILIQGLIEWVISMTVGTLHVRGAFIFFMLWIGPVGIYFLWKKWFKNTGSFASWGAMLSALYYLLNLGTVQVFYAPLEAFTVFYGLLPWAILSITNYLSDSSKKNLAVLFFAQVIFSMIGFIPPQFIAYGLMVFALLVGQMIGARRELIASFKKVLTVGIILLVANLYWLSPVGYYSIYGAKNYAEAKNNQVSTPDFQYMSEARGKWVDVALIRGFFIDSSDSVIKGEGKFFEIFEPWNNYLQGEVVWVGYGLFTLSMLGLLVMLVKKGKRSLGISIVLILVIGLIAIAQAEEPFITIANLTHQIPVIGQAFRAAFTKFVGLLIFVYSIGFGYGIWGMRQFLRGKWIIGAILVVGTISSLVFYMLPMFKGNLIYERMKVSIPGEYEQVMKFFSNQDKQGRIAYLPSAWMWGWQVHEWGYSGSGFLWYGIEQPILDRAFDVWSPYNETFYDQFSNALYANDALLVKKVLKQYDVRYMLLDESVIAPGQDSQILRTSETKGMANDLGWKQVWHEGFLTVWDTGNRMEQFVSAPSSYSLVDGDTVKTREDVIYSDVGTYVSANQQISKSVTIYPFAGLMKEEAKNVEYGDNEITLNAPLSPKTAQGSEIIMPGWKVGDIVRIEYATSSSATLGTRLEPVPAYKVNGQDGPRFLGKETPKAGENFIVAKVGEGKEWEEYLKDSRFQMLDSSIKVDVAGEPTVYDFATQGNKDVSNCDVLKRGTAGKDGNRYYADERGSICDYVNMGELDTRLSYLMRLHGTDVMGRSLKFFLYNTGSKRNDLEYLLDKNKFDQTFGLLPWAWDGSYSLNISVQSFGQKTENVLQPVEVRWIPLEQIARSRISTTANGHIQNNLKIKEVYKIGTWLYRVKAEGVGLLRLSQGYDDGWVSFGLSHVKVDGWANGWIVPESGEATIFYWPQLLEYLGFAMLGATVLVLVVTRK